MPFRFRGKSIALVAIGAILASGVALVVYGALRSPPRAQFTGNVASLFPAAEDVPGWTIRREEIAATPEMKRAVGELLNYTDGHFVSYIKGDDRISIYVAYWKPGTMSHRLVAGHTPDVCWVGAGWERLAASTTPPLAVPGGKSLPVGEQRHMRLGSTKEWVVFWHIVGGETMSYGQDDVPWYAALAEPFTRGLDQRSEQFFVRISGPRMPNEWMLSDVMQRFLANARSQHVPL